MTDVVFSDLSDLSSVSSAPEQKFHLVGPAHGPGGRGAVNNNTTTTNNNNNNNNNLFQQSTIKASYFLLSYSTYTDQTTFGQC